MDLQNVNAPPAFVAGDPDLPVDPVIEAYKKDIDRSLVRQSLRLSVTERFEELMELERFAEALRDAPTVLE